ncbi:MAG: GTPase domain-containing protein [Prevotella sp.]|uniref:GTPase domain-containing protein n=1 Tax=Prevotella sp. TaxID=59823 RepID=UPI002A2CF957|nr:GTPase domain-containing protein [Prevotella sp.]MDD7317765.1 GTPase domain-containing protein [Prevotellaceae bacterium]MDY4020680.1 GTPase domain-containing protein [Prevotella sp.]
MVTTNESARAGVEREYRRIVAELQKAAADMRGTSGRDAVLAQTRDALATTMERLIAEYGAQAEQAMESTVWDRLVIAFFGETNAGKSTVIETMRILTNEATREMARSQTGSAQDGMIVGDGSADFTKVYCEYRLKINGKPFTLIDVPGIEGREEDYSEEMKRALGKAHCIFYVQGHNKQPDTATAEKIKRYLKDRVGVYTIYNIRGGGGDYDEPEERETLMTEKTLKTEALIVKTFGDILGEHYKGNVSLQGLVAMCSVADFAESRTDLMRTQRKLKTLFGNGDTMFRFSRMDRLVQLIDGMADHFLEEIVEANKQKMISLARLAYRGIADELQRQQEATRHTRLLLHTLQGDIRSAATKAQAAIERDIKLVNDKEYNALKDRVCIAIDNKRLNDAQRKFAIEQLEAAVPGNVERGINEVVARNIGEMNEYINMRKQQIDYIPLAGRLDIIDPQKRLGSFFVSTKRIEKALSPGFGDVGSLAVSMAGGASVGSLFTFIAPGVATAVGAMLGGLSHLARKTIFGDGRRSKAKQVARRQIDTARIDSKIRLRELIQNINGRIAEKRDRMSEAIEQETRNLQTAERIIEEAQRGITKFIEDIKSKEYGTI